MRVADAKAAADKKAADAGSDASARKAADAAAASKAAKEAAVKAAADKKAADAAAAKAAQEAAAKATKAAGDPRIRPECADKCTPVQIFFGTDRKRETLTKEIKFGPSRAGQLQLGRAVVTVPKVADRRRGEVRLPSWFERNVLRVPERGDPAKHFVILTDGFKLYASAADFLADVRLHVADAGEFKDHAFIFVHGFNVTFDAALYRTAQIAYDLGYDDPVRGHVPFGTAFLYSWPSGGRTQDYLYDGDSARQAADHLKRFVELVTAQSGAKQVHLVAHSMGNLALLNALKDFKSPPGGARINQVVLAAPDIDVKEFEALAQAIVPIARHVTLYASSRDVAMIAARRARRNEPRAGDIVDAGPVIVPKVYSIDISELSTEIMSIRHSEYADKKELIDDINRLLIKGEQPPNMRNTNFLRRLKDGAEYWQYAK